MIIHDGGERTPNSLHTSEVDAKEAAVVLAGVLIISTERPMEVQFDEHKLLIIYARDLKPFEAGNVPAPDTEGSNARVRATSDRLGSGRS